jgi:hypothetical protein
VHRVDAKHPPHPFSNLDRCTHHRLHAGFAGLAYVRPAGGLRVIVDACGPPGAEDQRGDVVPLGGQFVPRPGDPCLCLSGKRQESGSLVRFVARKRRSIDAHQPADFINNRVKDLYGGHAPREEPGYPPKRGLLSLDLREMRINSGAIR